MSVNPNLVSLICLRSMCVRHLRRFETVIIAAGLNTLEMKNMPSLGENAEHLAHPNYVVVFKHTSILSELRFQDMLPQPKLTQRGILAHFEVFEGSEHSLSVF